MVNDQFYHKKKQFIVLSLLALSLALLSRAIRPLPPGPWAGIYASFSAFWLLVIISYIILLAAAIYSRINLGQLYVLNLLIVLSIASQGVYWGEPARFDSWVHLNIIQSPQINVESTIYPIYHFIMRMVLEITQLNAEEVGVLSAFITTSINISLIYGVVSRLNTSRSVKCLISIISSPAAIFFIARPYSLYPVVLIIYWSIFSKHTSRASLIAIVFAPMLVFLHPIVAIIAFVIFTVAILHSDKRDRSHYTLPAILLGITIVFRIITSNYGQFVLITFAQDLLVGTGGGSSTGTPAGVGILGSALSSPQRAFELVIRIVYPVILSGLVALGYLSVKRAGLEEHQVSLTFISGTLVASVLSIIILFVQRGIGIFRVLSLAPILTISGLMPMISRVKHRSNVLCLVLCILIITSASITVYNSGFNGGTELSATPQIENGAEWVSMNAEDVAITRVAGGIVSGRHDWTEEQRIINVRATPKGDIKYSWQSEDSSLIFVDGSEIARAHRDEIETSDTPLKGLEKLRGTGSQVYSNGVVEIYAV